MKPFPLLLLCISVASCSSPSLHKQNHDALTAALGEIAAEDFEEAAQRMELMLAKTSSAPATYGPQRFFASFLLARSHELAAYQRPFLQEAARQSGFLMDAGGSTGTGSSIGHLVAVTYHANAARQLYSTAQGGELVIEGEGLVPAELVDLGAANALTHLNLSLLAVYARLNFEERCDHILSGMSGLLDVDACQETLEAAQVDPAVRAWIFKGIFEYAKSRDEPLAYKFGILAREAAGDSAGSFTDATSDAIARWITAESSYTFRSPAGQLFDPALSACTVSGTPNIDFEAERK